MSASKHSLSNLTVIVDYNKFQSYGPTETVLGLEPLVEKWKSFGFETVEVDGHSPTELIGALNKTSVSLDRPSAIIAHTVKGKGFPMAENRPEWHHKSRLSDEDIAQLYLCLQ